MAARRATRSRAPSVRRPALPAHGTVVDVGMCDRDRRWRTRVEWAEGTRLCVIAPLRPDGQVWPLLPGARLLVGWPSPLGFLEATCGLEEVSQDVVRSWLLTVERVDRQQRREAYRLEIAVPAILRHGDRAPVEVRPVVARAEVVRALEPSTSEVELGLRFTVVEAAATEQLRRYVFEEQLRRRNAGT